jgi:calpain-15
MTWKKARNVWAGSDISVATPEPWDIEQGELGDCYFLGSISALAEVPARIQKVFAS